MTGRLPLLEWVSKASRTLWGFGQITTFVILNLPTIGTLSDISGNGVSGTHRIYSECANDVEVQLYLLEGVGHDWPENYEVDGNGGTGQYDINSAEIIWAFFNNFDQLGRKQ